TPGTSSLTAGDSVAYELSGVDEFDNPVTVTADDVDWTVPEGAAVTDGTVTFTKAEDATVAVTLSSDSSVTAYAHVTVAAGDIASLTLTPDSSSVTAGDSVDYAVNGFDAYDNPITVTADDVDWTVPDGTTIINGTVTFPTAGAATVTVTLVGDASVMARAHINVTAMDTGNTDTVADDSAGEGGLPATGGSAGLLIPAALLITAGVVVVGVRRLPTATRSTARR
ncbi:hypothetical protein, partial [Demequina sediminicola]|uniref:hypothetical protein n=1 Tax=Demequina sediminicola TaxID=1095026 RepID=UPI000ACF0DAF